MKSAILLPSILSSLLVASALLGCASNPAPADTYPGTVKQESSSDFANAQACAADVPCPTGLECMFVAAFDQDTPICVDSNTICAAIDCGDGDCFVLESYPAQLVCAGEGSPPDDGSEDCTVSSDGTTVCPEDGSGSDQSEPGQS